MRLNLKQEKRTPWPLRRLSRDLGFSRAHAGHGVARLFRPGPALIVHAAHAAVAQCALLLQETPPELQVHAENEMVYVFSFFTSS